MWTRFVWNGDVKLLDKPAWMGLTRMTTNRNYKDATSAGDRTLAIWVGAGFYLFTTYTTDNVNVYANVDYGMNLDGQWNFVYYCY
jgi:hypothetical protein